MTLKLLFTEVPLNCVVHCCTLRYCTTLHCCTVLHYTLLVSTALHCTAMYITTLDCVLNSLTTICVLNELIISGVTRKKWLWIWQNRLWLINLRPSPWIFSNCRLTLEQVKLAQNSEFTVQHCIALQFPLCTDNGQTAQVWSSLLIHSFGSSDHTIPKGLQHIQHGPLSCDPSISHNTETTVTRILKGKLHYT